MRKRFVPVVDDFWRRADGFCSAAAEVGRRLDGLRRGSGASTALPLSSANACPTTIHKKHRPNHTYTEFLTPPGSNPGWPSSTPSSVWRLPTVPSSWKCSESSFLPERLIRFPPLPHLEQRSPPGGLFYVSPAGRTCLSYRPRPVKRVEIPEGPPWHGWRARGPAGAGARVPGMAGGRRPRGACWFTAAWLEGRRSCGAC